MLNLKGRTVETADCSLECLCVVSIAWHIRASEGSIPNYSIPANTGSCMVKLYYIYQSAFILFSGHSAILADSSLNHPSRNQTCEWRKPSSNWILILQVSQFHWGKNHPETFKFSSWGPGLCGDKKICSFSSFSESLNSKNPTKIIRCIGNFILGCLVTQR